MSESIKPNIDTSDGARRTFVVAQSHDLFQWWLRATNSNPRLFRYVDRIDDLRGCRGGELIRLNGYYKQRGLDYLDQLIRMGHFSKIIDVDCDTL